ncbi:MAG: hypothetical protein ACRC10_06680 [Thermoguttaceae bacterium]
MFERARKISGSLFCSLSLGLLFLCAFVSSNHLLAQEPSFGIEDVSQKFRDQFGRTPNSISETTFFIIATVVLGTIIFLIWLYYQYYGRRHIKGGFHNERELFNELCQGHQLTREQQNILRRIAKELKLSTPSLLFIDPKYLEQTLYDRVVPYPTHLLQELLMRLFGEVDLEIGTQGGLSTSMYSWTSISDGLQETEMYSARNDVGGQTATTLLRSVPKEVSEQQSGSGSATGTGAGTWDSEFWSDIEKGQEPQKDEKKDGGKTGGGPTTQEHSGLRSASHFAPVLAVPPLREEVLKTDQRAYHASETVSSARMIPPSGPGLEKTTYKPQYPESSEKGTSNTNVDVQPPDSSQSGTSIPTSNSSKESLHNDSSMNGSLLKNPSSNASSFNASSPNHSSESNSSSNNSSSKNSPFTSSTSSKELQGSVNRSHKTEEPLNDFRQTKILENPTVGTRVFSSLIQSMSQVSEELTASSVQNLLNRPVSLSPKSLQEMKVNPTFSRRPPISPIAGQNRTVRPGKPVATGLLDSGQGNVVVEQIDLESLGIQVPGQMISGQSKRPTESSASKTDTESGEIGEIAFIEQLIASPKSPIR